MKGFEKPFKGWAGWEVTLFGFQLFRYNDEQVRCRQFLFDCGMLGTKNPRRWEVRKVA